MKKLYSVLLFLLNFLLSCALVEGQVHSAGENGNSSRVQREKSEALQEMKLQRYGEAIELLNRYISAYPQNVDGYSLRGLCFEKRGQYELAVYDFKSARKLEPANKDVIENLNRAEKAWYSLLYSQIEGYKREIAINPKIPNNYLEIGKCYKNLGEWKEAENWYDEYIKREEPSADELIRYTEILARNNHISQGWKLLEKYTIKYPNDHRIWSKFGYFSYWLGKKKTAIDAFKNALALKPYFKEAMNGLDLAEGRGYVYTINDTSAGYNYGLPVASRYSGYPIDRYYRILKNNPSDTTIRYKLIEELAKVKRFEEAYNQLQILGKTNSSSSRFQRLWTDIIDKRKEYLAEKISEYESKLSEKPGSRKIILKLGMYYSLYGENDKAINLYHKYLTSHSSDNEIRYKYAELLLWNKDLCSAKDNLEILIQSDRNNTDYQLLLGKVLFWLDVDLYKAQIYLQDVVKRQPDNFDAVITLANLELQTDNLTEAEQYLYVAEKLEPDSEEVNKLNYHIKLAKGREKKDKLFVIVDKARKYAAEKDCIDAIKYFKDYLLNPDADQSVKTELADAYLCMKDYQSAINIYKDILKTKHDFDIEKQLAKVYYWSGDSPNALNEFKKLAALYPDDAEINLYLGDSYMKMKQYENAQLVYNNMLEKSPNSEIIKRRLSWLGRGVTGKFPTYIQISPESNYFKDNLSFLYTLQGLNFQLGINRYLAIGGSGFRGRLSSDSVSNNLTTIKGNLFVRINKYFSASAGIGKTYFTGDLNANLTELMIHAEKEKRYKVSLSFNSSDAALLLYSPYLVNKRLQSDYYSAEGSYYSPSSLLLYGKFSYITVSGLSGGGAVNNFGDNIVVRIGKQFDSTFSGGYEYYYYNFNDSTTLYWSPANFESHSVWGDFNIYISRNFDLGISGKIGIIPQNNYVLREISGSIKYYFMKDLLLQGRLTAGSTVKQRTGYNSLSFGVSVYWTF
jgi:tetratricopeptide (TPR) repeat protein